MKYKSESHYFQSEEFATAIEAQIVKETWEKGKPRIYISEGWIIEHWPDGTKIKLKESK